MKSFKKFYTVFEQAILLNLVIAYLISFMFVFDEQIRNTEWMGLIWISQFIILGILLVKRSKQKGWAWPSRP
jgi:hypothetical protein